MFSRLVSLAFLCLVYAAPAHADMLIFRSKGVEACLKPTGTCNLPAIFMEIPQGILMMTKPEHEQLVAQGLANQPTTPGPPRTKQTPCPTPNP